MKKKNYKFSEMSFNKKMIILTIIFIVFMFLFYYVVLPIFNFGNVGFYLFLGFVSSYIVSFILMLLSDKLIDKNSDKTYSSLEYDKHKNTLVVMIQY